MHLEKKTTQLRRAKIHVIQMHEERHVAGKGGTRVMEIYYQKRSIVRKVQDIGEEGGNRHPCRASCTLVKRPISKSGNGRERGGEDRTKSSWRNKEEEERDCSQWDGSAWSNN